MQASDAPQRDDELAQFASQQKYCDCVVLCGNQRFELHRCNLAEFSPFFDVRFETLVGSQSTTVDLRPETLITAPALACLLQRWYRRATTWPPPAYDHLLADVLLASHFLQDHTAVGMVLERARAVVPHQQPIDTVLAQLQRMGTLPQRPNDLLLSEFSSCCLAALSSICGSSRDCRWICTD